MTNKILIDAAHSDEMRAVILKEGRLADYEVESSGKEQIKSNLYVGEVTRVEPSLQAAFINYGGNRNGFLAFGEVHPSFFDVPEKERKSLVQELEDIAARKRGENESKDGEKDESATTEEASAEEAEAKEAAAEEELSDEDARALALANSMADEEGAPTIEPEKKKGRGRPKRNEKSGEDDKPKRQPPIHRRYAIQNVLKPGQKVLVQVVKEERGTKGAALTTYFSLPGRYTVLMPNTPYAGGISRKITGQDARKKMRETMDSLKIPNGMGLIVRTAGIGQEQDKIQADLKNITSLWKKIQKSSKDGETGECVHEDGSLAIRALRDMYNEDVEEILISGKRAYQAAKDFAKALMPDLAKIIKEYKPENEPLFTKYGVEDELAAMHKPRVTLPSGGYIIINPTEALVSIDVNSGRATQGNNLEETALKTNLEAAEEVARQMRLRDLSGLVVVDFIDQEWRRNSITVERAMKKAVRKDRARIQVGNMSEFGLVEISRQRLRPSLAENTLMRCPHCHGAGWVPTLSSAALNILRALESDEVRRNADRVIVSASTDLAIHILNHKKDLIKDLEAKYKYKILIQADDDYIAPDFKFDLVLIKSDGTESVTEKVYILREDPDEVIEVQRNNFKGGGRRRGGRDRDERDESKPKSSGRRKKADEGEAKPARKRAAKKSDEAKDATPEEESAPQPVKSRGRRPKRAGKVVTPDLDADTKEADATHTEHTANAESPEETPKKPVTRGGRRRMVKAAAVPATEADTADTPEKEEVVPAPEVAEKAAVKRGRRPSLGDRVKGLLKG